MPEGKVLARHGGRYFTGAILCALANNVVLIVGDAVGLLDILSVGLTWLIGGSIGYVWHYRLTFAESSSLRGYAQFMAGVALGIPLTYLTILLFHHGFAWSMWLAAPATTLALVPYNYFNARLAIVRRLVPTPRT